MSQFSAKHKMIICIDSDGCAMDTMDIKHEECFGPIAATHFQIEKVDTFLDLWNRINLFSHTRGINRFKGLVLSLEEYGYSGDIQSLKHWVETTLELSNRSLEEQITQFPYASDLKTALAWSQEVNEAIKTLRSKDKPFARVQESLAMLKQFADIAVVSSANNEAILDEWTRHDLMPYVDLVYGQEEGTKAYCIEQLKKYGYDEHHILMVGDSPGDLAAALKTGVYFYPILCKKEEFSWNRLVLEALGKLHFSTFDSNYQKQLITEFEQNLANQ